MFQLNDSLCLQNHREKDNWFQDIHHQLGTAQSNR
jgi:hypothetical protein